MEFLKTNINYYIFLISYTKIQMWRIHMFSKRLLRLFSIVWTTKSTCHQQQQNTESWNVQFILCANHFVFFHVIFIWNTFLSLQGRLFTCHPILSLTASFVWPNYIYQLGENTRELLGRFYCVIFTLTLSCQSSRLDWFFTFIASLYFHKRIM